MGHMNGKDIYKKLGKKIDKLSVRAPWNASVHAILKELYSPEEADFVIKMPYGMSNLKRVKKITGYEETKLKRLLDKLCSKGLVMDLWVKDEYYYMPSPMVVGIFEFTMMRTGNNLNSEGWAKLFHQYMQREDSVLPANFKNGEKISIMRSLPHEGTIAVSDYVEILDYEKATNIIEGADKFAIGICSCRHEKHHVGEKGCDVPLDTCTSFGIAADYLIRNNLAKEVSKSEMLENFARSKEMGLVLSADNVKQNVSFVCHCCACCCNVLQGIKNFGYPNILVTSSFIAHIDEETCVGCGKCAKACNIDAIEMIPINDPDSKKKKRPELDTAFCLGCGVCALKCKSGAMKLVPREQRVLHPETTFERVILQCLERGTLQNQLFDNPKSITHKFMRGFTGAVLRLPPVKKTLMSDMFRSSFLKAMTGGIKKQRNEWMTEM
ncbi:MAG: 4Fe-4S binding protein [Deltaproteobacteria bacterium]|nr:4Fe-4S binding protein [Deltaproteobacteria bacterium]